MSAIGEEKPPLMPSDHGLPENSPWPQTRSRQERAGALRQGNQRRFGIGNDRAPAAKNEWALRALQSISEFFDRTRIGMKPSAARTAT